MHRLIGIKTAKKSEKVTDKRCQINVDWRTFEIKHRGDRSSQTILINMTDP